MADTINVAITEETIILEMTAGVSWNQVAGKPTPVAENTFIVSNIALAWVVKTLAEVKTILGVGSSDTEKVRYDVDDLAAGYLAEKIIAGTGITLSEGTGADENKLKITSHASGSDAETASSIIALGIDEIEFAVIKSYMI